MEHHPPPVAVRAAVLVVFGLLLSPAATFTFQDQKGAAGAPRDLPRALTTEAYLTPPKPVLDAVLATTVEDVRLANPNPDLQLFLRTVGDGFPTLDRFARRHYNLGQMQIDPAANRSRRLTTRSDTRTELYGRDGKLVRALQVPDGARVTNAEWSPDGSQIAFFAHFDDATHVYVADASTGQSRRLTTTPVLATLVTSFEWADDGEHVVTVLVPANRGPEPSKPAVPASPAVRLTTPEKNRLRTYFDLLEDPYEKSLVRYYTTGQLARIDVASGRAEPIGAPAMIEDIDVSPDGDYLRVTTMKDQLSYIVPVSSAGSREEIWDVGGKALALIDEDDLNESAEGAGDQDGDDNGDPEKRNLAWERGGGATLVYLQQQPRPAGAKQDPAAAKKDPASASPDAGRGGQEAQQDEDDDRPDRVMRWRPPFDAKSVEVVYQTADEIQSAAFDESGRVLFLTRRDGGDETVHAVFLDDPKQEFLVYEADTDDVQEEPGSLMNTRTGAVRLSADRRFVFLSGTQYFENPSVDAPRPFVDRVEIRTGTKERIFQSRPDVYERVDLALDDDLSQVIVTRESPAMVPNQWLVDRASGQSRQLTFNVDRHPQITSARREILTITRPDGFKSRVTVTLPAGYRDGTRLPAMFWFYPREFTEQSQYDERFERFNKNDFQNVGARSMHILTLLGYAVVEPDVPIVGPEGQRNDEYPHDLRNTLATVIDELSDRGWIDRRRLAIGGHSYGAFGTANAMIHTPFFKAGIAGDGNYNRSLTPAGFQSERRYLWEAQDLYIEMSPFFQADRLTGALLMYHGMDDHNVGTHPIHSDRMFHALEVLGKTAALYKYPYEDHGPATRETTLDLWARWVAWLDEHVKNAEITAPNANSNGSGR
jgi:dipeptidyl aminopeptidase/acylaminoacyl peptidase